LAAVFVAYSWAAIAVVRVLTVPAGVRMTPTFWAFTVAGFLFGYYAGGVVSETLRGGVYYVRMARYCPPPKEPNTLLGALVFYVLLPTCFGMFCANSALAYALGHP
jgi:hypothetical protein